MRRAAAVLLAALAALAVLPRAPALAQEPCAPDKDALAVRVARVVDGATLDLAGGQQVRLAGLAWTGPGDATDAAAAAGLREMLAGRAVMVDGLRRADRHGRIVALLFTAGDEPVLVQRRLAARGLARVLPMADNPACTAVLLAAEAAARRAGLGGWAAPTGEPDAAAFAVRGAEPPDALLALADTFQIVEGRVRSTGATGSRAYLNFGARWKEDFTGVIGAAHLDDFIAAGLAPSLLAGQTVRLRGYVQSHDGPMIELTDPGQIEVIETR